MCVLLCCGLSLVCISLLVVDVFCVCLLFYCVSLVACLWLVCVVSAGVPFLFGSLVAIVVLIAVCVDIVEPMLNRYCFLRACIDCC